ncbi:MAG: glycosyltransferase family 87 protein [Elusimicrobiota bacterium]
MTPRKILLAAAALIPLALMIWGFRGLRSEDFMYYYCAGATANAGASPYEEIPFRDCVRAASGIPYVRLMGSVGSAYPPPAIAVFRTLALLSYDRAFILWNVLLAAATLALLSLLGRGGADTLLILTWPGIAMCWIFHKFSLVAAVVFLAAAVRLDDAPAMSGAILGFLALQPQWLAAGGLYLAALRRWKPLGIAAGVAASLFLLTTRAGWLSQWTLSAGVHAAALTSYDNQSFFLAFYKRLGWLGAAREAWFLPGRAAAGALLGALAFHAARRGAGLAVFLGIVLLAQPYTHSSDAIWALPLLLLARDRWRALLGWRSSATAAAFIAVNLLLCWACLRTPHGRLESADRQGYLGLFAILLWLAAEAAGRARLKSRRNDPRQTLS